MASPQPQHHVADSFAFTTRDLMPPAVSGICAEKMERLWESRFAQADINFLSLF